MISKEMFPEGNHATIPLRNNQLELIIAIINYIICIKIINGTYLNRGCLSETLKLGLIIPETNAQILSLH